ncbi:MAG: hypothetical protein AAAFM81_09260 [Pseudomonadota bacterium]
MFKAMLRLSAIALAMTLSNQALAEGDRGFGISAGLGLAQLGDEDDNLSFDGNTIAGSVDLEFRTGEHFALGLGFLKTGNAEDTVNGADTEIDAAIFGFFGRIILPGTELGEPYLRFGGSLFGAGAEGGPEGLRSDFDGLYEVGGGYDFALSERTDLRLQVQYFFNSDDETALVATAGFAFNF